MGEQIGDIGSEPLAAEQFCLSDSQRCLQFCTRFKYPAFFAQNAKWVATRSQDKGNGGHLPQPDPSICRWARVTEPRIPGSGIRLWVYVIGDVRKGTCWNCSAVLAKNISWYNWSCLSRCMRICMTLKGIGLWFVASYIIVVCTSWIFMCISSPAIFASYLACRVLPRCRAHRCRACCGLSYLHLLQCSVFFGLRNRLLTLSREVMVITSPAGAVAKYCDERVSRFVCLPVCKDISGTTRAIFRGVWMVHMINFP